MQNVHGCNGFKWHCKESVTTNPFFSIDIGAGYKGTRKTEFGYSFFQTGKTQIIYLNRSICKHDFTQEISINHGEIFEVLKIKGYTRLMIGFICVFQPWYILNQINFLFIICMLIQFKVFVYPP